jgi:uncharacterized protein YndB with AHSA1/START domain
MEKKIPSEEIPVRPTALHLTAVRLKRSAPDEEVWVHGTVREVAPPHFKVLGIRATTSAGTVFRGMDATQFFRLLTPGRVVKVQGVLVNNQLAAREVGFENLEEDEEDHGVV